MVTCSAVIAALSLSGSALWNKVFSTYDFTLDVVFLFHKWFVYEVMLSISSFGNDGVYLRESYKRGEMSSICLLWCFKSASSVEGEWEMMLTRMEFIV